MDLRFAEEWLNVEKVLVDRGLTGLPSYSSDEFFRWKPKKNLSIQLILDLDRETNEKILTIQVLSNHGWMITVSSDNSSIFHFTISCKKSNYADIDHPWIGKNIFDVLENIINNGSVKLKDDVWEMA